MDTSHTDIHLNIKVYTHIPNLPLVWQSNFCKQNCGLMKEIPDSLIHTSTDSPLETRKKIPEIEMGFEPTTLRDQVGCSSRLSRGFKNSRSLLAEVSFLLRALDWRVRKKDLCRGSKLTVLSMCSGYLAAESSRDASFYVGSLNNSGINLKECARHSGPSHSPQTYHEACGLKSPVQGWRLDNSEFRPMAVVSFFPNTAKKKKKTSAVRE